MYSKRLKIAVSFINDECKDGTNLAGRGKLHYSSKWGQYFALFLTETLSSKFLFLIAYIFDRYRTLTCNLSNNRRRWWRRRIRRMLLKWLLLLRQRLLQPLPCRRLWLPAVAQSADQFLKMINVPWLLRRRFLQILRMRTKQRLQPP